MLIGLDTYQFFNNGNFFPHSNCKTDALQGSLALDHKVSLNFLLSKASGIFSYTVMFVFQISAAHKCIRGIVSYASFVT